MKPAIALLTVSLVVIIVVYTYPKVMALESESEIVICKTIDDGIQRVTDNMARAWRTGDIEDINGSIDYFNLYINGI